MRRWELPASDGSRPEAVATSPIILQVSGQSFLWAASARKAFGLTCQPQAGHRVDEPLGHLGLSPAPAPSPHRASWVLSSGTIREGRGRRAKGGRHCIPGWEAPHPAGHPSQLPELRMGGRGEGPQH